MTREDLLRAWKGCPQIATQRCKIAAEWRRSRRENPGMARLVYRAAKKARARTIDAIFNTPTHVEADGLLALTSFRRDQNS